MKITVLFLGQTAKSAKQLGSAIAPQQLGTSPGGRLLLPSAGFGDVLSRFSRTSAARPPAYRREREPGVFRRHLFPARSGSPTGRTQGKIQSDRKDSTGVSRNSGDCLARVPVCFLCLFVCFRSCAALWTGRETRVLFTGTAQVVW